MKFSKVAGKDTNEHTDKANDLCFVVKCFILRQNIEHKICPSAAWCEVRPHERYVQKLKKELPGSRRVKRTLQTGNCLTSLWGFGGGQRVPVGHSLDQIKPGRLGATHTEWFPVCLAFLFFFFFFLYYLPLNPVNTAQL